MTSLTTLPAFRFHQGTRPLLLSIPHMGTYVPPAIAAGFTAEARQVPDTDWHLDQLYAFAVGMGASVLQATHSRYVVDLNRPPDNANLYPGQDTTGLCPVDTFDATPIYLPGQVPDEVEVAARREAIWVPYHQQLELTLRRLHAEFGTVVLWDAHSIRSVLPRFFTGKLPDLNFGTASGTSCAQALAQTLLSITQASTGYSAVFNGRFKGGYITRQYGRPEQGIHAVQLEMAQCTYMQEVLPFRYLPQLAAGVQPLLHAFLEAAAQFVENGG